MAQLTEKQAYLAMFNFLEHCAQTGWPGLEGLLGSMSLLADGSPVDGAFKRDWEVAVQSALEGDVDAQLSLK